MIAFFGAPGAGKSVQGQKTAARHGMRWISSRNLLMNLNDRDVTLALNHGMTVDAEKNLEVLAQTLSNYQNSLDRLVLDGFPSSVQQVYWMVEHGYMPHFDGAIVLRVPRGELWNRLVKRKRVDDTRAAVERRQDAYERAVTGMIRVLSMNGVKVREVDGRNTPDDVQERIDEVLGEWGLIRRKDFAKIDRNI